MLFSYVGILRVSFLIDKKEDVKEERFFVSLLAPSGFLLSGDVIVPNVSKFGTKSDNEVVMCCALNTDLPQETFFAVRQTPSVPVDVNNNVITLRCMLWRVRNTEKEENNNNNNTNLIGCHSTLDESPDSCAAVSCKSDVAASVWELIAEGSVNAMKYGMQIVELTTDFGKNIREDDNSAEGVLTDKGKAHVKSQISIFFFVLPRLVCTVEEMPKVLLPVETRNSLQPTGLEKACDDCEHVVEVTLADSGSFDGSSADAASKDALSGGEQEEDDVSSSSLLNSDEKIGAALWVLFVEIAPWFESVSRGGCGALGSSSCHIDADAFSDANKLWKLAVCGDDGRVLANGSPFRTSVCCRCGWSDAMVIFENKISAGSVISLQLQELLPAENINTDERGANDVFFSPFSSFFFNCVVSDVKRPVCSWKPLATSDLLPVADLLCLRSLDSCMQPVLMFADRSNDNLSSGPNIPFACGGRLVRAGAMLSRVPTTVGAPGGAGWMLTEDAGAAVFRRKIITTHSCNQPRERGLTPQKKTLMYSVALHVCAAVVFKLGSHVDIGAQYPLIALTVSGGCELLLDTKNECGFDVDGNDDSEPQRAPVVRFDSYLHTTVDEEHPLLLLTLHSPAAPEVVFGRAYFSPFTLPEPRMGHIWLPLYNDDSDDSDDNCDNSKGCCSKVNEGDCGCCIVGWIHCSFDCVLVLQERESSVASIALSKLSQQSLGTKNGENASGSLASTSPVSGLQRNGFLRLCVAEATNMHMGSACLAKHKRKYGVYVTVRVIPQSTCTFFSDMIDYVLEFTTPVLFSVSPRWNFSGTLPIDTDTTNIFIQVFVNHHMRGTTTECVGVVDIPRAAASRFWATSTGVAWLPLAAPRWSASRYSGALLLRWAFDTGVIDPRCGAVYSINFALPPGRPLSLRAQQCGVLWMRLDGIKLTWSWLLHCMEWRLPFTPAFAANPQLFLRVTSGQFAYELLLKPRHASSSAAYSGAVDDCGYGCWQHLFADESVLVPLTDRIDVTLYYYCHRGFPFLYLSVPYFLADETATKGVAVVGVGNFSLVTDDMAHFVASDDNCPRLVTTKVEPPAMTVRYSVQPGLLTAELSAARIARQVRHCYYCCSHNGGGKTIKGCSTEQLEGRQWTWPSLSCSTVAELQIGRIFLLNDQFKNLGFLHATSHCLSPSWTVTVRLKALNRNRSDVNGTTGTFDADVIYPSLTVKGFIKSAVTQHEDGDTLYLSWPALPILNSFQHRPPPPVVELIISRTETGSLTGDILPSSAFVASVVLDLQHCFEESKGTGLFLLCNPRTYGERNVNNDDVCCCHTAGGDSVENGGVVGLVELHYLHNFAEAKASSNYDCSNAGNLGDIKVQGNVKESKNLLLLSVVCARYRRCCSVFSLHGEESLTSFILGVGEMSWRTESRPGMTPEFNCQIAFAPSRPTGEMHVGEEGDDVIYVRLQMLSETGPTICDYFLDAKVEAIPMQRPANAFAFLALRRSLLYPFDRMNFGQWVPLYAVDEGVGDTCVIVGEVLLRWGLFDHFLWDRLAPLSVSTQRLSELPVKQHGEDCLPGFPLYLSVVINDYKDLRGFIFDAASDNEMKEVKLFVRVYIEATSQLVESSFISFLFDHEQRQQAQWRQHQHDKERYDQALAFCGSKYGDRTRATVFNSASNRCTWMERCFFPVIIDKRMKLHFELCRFTGSTSGDVLLFGCLRDCEIVCGGALTAVAMFSSGESRPCGVLTVTVALSPLYTVSTTTAPTVNQHGPREHMMEGLLAASKKENVGVEDIAADGVQSFYRSEGESNNLQLTLMRCSVRMMEIYGYSITPTDGCWELTLRSDSILAERGRHTYTRFGASPFVDGAGVLWSCLVCAMNMSEMEILLRRVGKGATAPALRKLKNVFGRFLLPSVFEAGDVLDNDFYVDLFQRTFFRTQDKCVNVPVGRVCMLCTPLVHSGVLYDPFAVFFRRSLRLVVTELFGVVCAVRGKRRKGRCRPRRCSHLSFLHCCSKKESAPDDNDALGYAAKEVDGDKYGYVSCREKNEEALLYIRLECETEAVISPLFAPPVVEIAKEREKLSGDKKLLTTTNSDANDVLQLSLSLDCCPTDSNSGVDVRLSLHLSSLFGETTQKGVELQDLANDLLIGEAVEHVPPLASEYGLNSAISTATVTTRTTAKTEEILLTASAMATGRSSLLKDCGTARWVPIPAIGEKLSKRMAYAHMHYAWSTHVALGSWLMSVLLRSAKKQPALNHPFICFVMRFQTGELFSLPFELLDDTFSKRQGNCFFAAPTKHSRSVWSFSHIKLPLVWPLGAQVERVELHDRVAAGLTVHLGTHNWTASDTSLFVPFGNGEDKCGRGAEGLFASQPSLLSSFFEGRWLRFGAVDLQNTDVNKESVVNPPDSMYEVLMVRSMHPPTAVEATKALHVPFYWWPVKTVLHLDAPGVDIAALEASKLVVTCTMHIGRWHSAGATPLKRTVSGWVWENSNENIENYYGNEEDGFFGNEIVDTFFASHTAINLSSATVTATWDAVASATFTAFLGGEACGVFRRYISLSELRDMSALYAVSIEVVCRMQCDSTLVSKSPIKKLSVGVDNTTVLCKKKTIFVLDDCCAGIFGEVDLAFLEANCTGATEGGGAGGSLTMAWVIAHDQITSVAPRRIGHNDGFLSSLFLEEGDTERKGDDDDGMSGKMTAWRLDEEFEETQEKRSVMPSWVVTSIEAQNLPVVLDVSATTASGTGVTAHAQPNISVLAQLVIERKSQRSDKKCFFSESDTVTDVVKRKKRKNAVFPLVFMDAAPATRLRRRFLYNVHTRPMWRIGPSLWMNHRRTMHLTLLQKLSTEVEQEHRLGTLRFDTLLRSAFAGIQSAFSDAKCEFPEEIVTDWNSLFQEGMMEQDITGRVRFRLRPVIHSFTDKRLDVCRKTPVCVEVKGISVYSHEGADLLDFGDRLALLFYPAGCTSFGSCSATRLQGRAAAAPAAAGDTACELVANSNMALASTPSVGKDEKLLTPSSFLASLKFHNLLIKEELLDFEAGCSSSLGIDVVLVECRGGGGCNSGVGGDLREGEDVGAAVEREDIVRVLCVDRIDLRHLWCSFMNQDTAGVCNRLPAYGTADLRATLCFFSNVVTVYLHVVALWPLQRPVEKEIRGGKSVVGLITSPKRCSQFLCSDDCYGEDNSKIIFGDIMCAVGDRVYRIAGTEVYEWDVNELRRGCSCFFAVGAITHSIPRLRSFKWNAVVSGETTVTPYNLRFLRPLGHCRIGHTTWLYDKKRIIISGGICTLSRPQRLSSLTPPPQQWPRQKAPERWSPYKESPRKSKFLKRTPCRSEVSENSVDGSRAMHITHDRLFFLPCYDIGQQSWGQLLIDEDAQNFLCFCTFYSAVVLNGKAWFFGGFCFSYDAHDDKSGIALSMGSASATTLSNRLTCFDFPTSQWITVEPSRHMTIWANCPDHAKVPFTAVKTPLPSFSPPPVACHTAVGCNEQIFVFGGLREVFSQGDAAVLTPSDAMYVFNVSRLEWWSLSPPAATCGCNHGKNSGCWGELNGGHRNWPCARYAHAATVVPEHPNGAFIIFGGATRLLSSTIMPSGTTVLCPFDELLWVYYATPGYWQNIRIPSCIPLTRRMFSSVQAVKLAEAPCASYIVVVSGGCDPFLLKEGYGQHGFAFKEGRNLLDVCTKYYCHGDWHFAGLPDGNAMKSVLSAVFDARWMGTVWILLEQRND